MTGSFYKLGKKTQNSIMRLNNIKPSSTIHFRVVVQALGPGGWKGRLSSADWSAGRALAQFRLMSGQLEVHPSALCTAAVSLNLCCCGPYPQPGHSPREALTLRPILL